MKRFMFIATTFLLLATAVKAQSPEPSGRVGVGVIIGEPTGIAWKYRINEKNSLSGGFGTSPYDRYRIHADYLWMTHPFEEQHLGVHYGLGAVVGMGPRRYVIVDGQRRYYVPEGDPGFGIRGVAGLTYTIPETPLDVFLEAGPLVVLVPGYGTGVDVGLGMRVYP